MKVLIACEFSGIVRDAFIKRGHEAVSCDILPTESDGPHYQGDVLDIIDDGWDMMIAHPPCTYICIANAPHYSVKKYGKDKVAKRRIAQRQAVEFFSALLHAKIPKMCIENPRPLKLLTEWVGGYDQVIQPYHFGHKASKTTCLWLRSLPKLLPTKVVERGEFVKGKGKRTNPKWSNYLPAGPDRAKIRSKTFQGIADAMAEQWG